MAKFKKGDKVKIIDGHKNKCGIMNNCEDISYLIIDDVQSSGYHYTAYDSKGKMIGVCYGCYNDKDLTLFVKTSIDQVEVGDTVTDGLGKMKVLEVFTNTFIVSTIYNYTDTGKFLSFKEAENDGWKIVQPVEEIEELTMEEVCAQLGKTVKIKK